MVELDRITGWWVFKDREPLDRSPKMSPALCSDGQSQHTISNCRETILTAGMVVIDRELALSITELISASSYGPNWAAWESIGQHLRQALYGSTGDLAATVPASAAQNDQDGSQPT